MTGALFLPAPLNQFSFAAALIPPIVAVWQIIYFTNRDPDRLQTEVHIENKQLISTIGDNSRLIDGEIIIRPGAPLIDNPTKEDRE
jgi:hypothetical protein